MKYKIGLIILSLLVLPGISSAAVDISINTSGSYSTGTDSQFSAVLANYQQGLVSVLTFADTQASDIKSAMFQDRSGWVKLTPYQSGSDVIAKFVSDSSFETASGRSVPLRVNFTSGKTYVVGLSLQDGSGRTVSSSAAPLTVNGPKVLGESTVVNSTPAGTFTRTLKYGSKGGDVTALQQKLTAEGFYTGPITGFYGRQTQAAVKAYQIARGIAGANGIVGPATLSVLNQ